MSVSCQKATLRTTAKIPALGPSEFTRPDARFGWLHVHWSALWLGSNGEQRLARAGGMRMKRREFVGLLGGAAATTVWPQTSRAQQSSNKVFRVGFLGLPSADSLPERTEAFRAGLRDLGYEAGRNVVIEYRWADSH